MSDTTRPPNRTEARRLVQSIARDHGHIAQEVLDRMPDADRREVEHALRRKDHLISSTVVTLARNLYTSDARFVLELLQNAEDNDFTRARAHGETPKVSFSVYPNHVVVECNEDGFTERNLRAICDVGKSSKTGAQGYIGEKGIGFKSVFMAAYRVHIQSGHFSFHFLHRQGDSGMGMITPVWEDKEKHHGDRCTRITLDLQQNVTPAEQLRRNQTIRQQFREIHDTILLFMKKIQEIKIEFYDQEKSEVDEPVMTITHSIDRQGTRAVCKKHTSEMGREQTHLRHYHITKYTTTGLAKAEGRNYSEVEEASRAYSQSQVVLAFPVTAASVPILENQWVFAFLPVRQMGFKFLIQADFVTQANRQDIVTTSARNQGLVTGIADAFIQGVVQLCDHPKLQYQWMRYLPEESAYPWDGFWKQVIEEITRRLTSTPVLCPAIPGPFQLIRKSRRHRASHLDASGKPLLPDLDPGVYLSLKYQSEDLDRLGAFGLQKTTMAGLISRARSDLAAPRSRMRTIQDEDWQSRLAKLLHTPFRMQWEDRCREVAELNLLPLRAGGWTSATLDPVYYPEVEGTDLDVPPGLPLRVIDSKAAESASRKQLFDAVGVQSASVSDVRAAILERYDTAEPTLEESVSYFRFLYLTDCLASLPYIYRRFPLYSHRGGLEDGFKVDVYIRDDDNPYGAGQLLRVTRPGPEAGAGAPGLDVLFAHDVYFQDSDGLSTACDYDWRRWLTWHCSVWPFFPLTRETEDGAEEITPVCTYVAQNRPEKYLGLLKNCWDQDIVQYERGSAVIRDLGQVLVLCQGSGINMRPLNSTFLPIEELVALCSRFMLDEEFFPWLMLETPLDNETVAAEWKDLGSAFGLGYDRQLLDFALVVLKSILDANPSAKALRQPERVYALYGYLQAKVDESSDGAACRKKIRDLFESQSSVFVPRGKASRPSWVNPRQCLWKAPVTMRTKYTLGRVYEAVFSKNRGKIPYLESFFVHTLGVPNCTWEHIVEEIRDCKARSDVDLDTARELYECLLGMRLIGISANDLKRVFEDEALICGLDDSWYAAPNCLWSSTTTIRGKLVLNSLYGDLRDFFVGALGISELTAELVYDKLTAHDGPELSIEEAKETLVAFNSFLSAGSGGFDSKPVLENRVFPVRFPSGKIRLRGGAKGFALMDRKPLGEDFAALAKFLDFDMDEIRILQPLIQWLGLGDRYLSKSVKEISSADRESTRPISLVRRDIRRKAHALLRIAVSYNSPRTSSDQNELYALLRNSETLETEAITAELLLNQDDKILRVTKESASLHIHEDTDGLKIYVPRDRRSQEVCFNSKLPRRLCEWIMTDPTTQTAMAVSADAMTVIQSVLTAQPFALDDILDEHGIVEAEIDESDSEMSIADEDDAEEENAKAENTSVGADDEFLTRPETPPSGDSPQSEPSSSSSRGLVTPLSSAASPEVISTSYVAARSSHAASRPRLRPMGAYGVAVEGNSYSSLLRDVVDRAKRAAFPSRGVFDMSVLDAALPGSPGNHDAGAEVFRLRSTTQLERDKQIGAAGELFVFEMLSRLRPRLPGFSRANWRSTIRDYVAAHPKYADMAPWVGRETADITYRDVDGVFTSLLIDKGYLNAETWASARPLYFLEVKTTTGSYKTPFFMSKYQYRRMRDNSNHDSDSCDTVYVVFRVFKLGTDDTGVRILVDPESMRLRDELSFTAESWSVVPAA